MDSFTRITNEIVKAIEGGTVPWRKRWKTGGFMPRNAAAFLNVTIPEKEI